MVRDQAGSSFGAVTAAGADRASQLEVEVTGLFDRWRDPLLGYVTTLGLPLQEGEEIIQEVFLSLFQHLRSGRPRDNLRGWIFRVGHNLALKRRYGSGRPLPGTLDEPRDPGLNPEQALAVKQRQALLQSVVAALPEQDRCCLYLRAEGLRYREIAEALGMSLGSVAISLGRALERLRRADRR